MGSMGTQTPLLSCRKRLAADSAPKNHHFYMVDNAKFIKSGFPTSWAQMSSYNSLDGAQSSSYHSSLSTKVIINLSSILLTQLSFSGSDGVNFTFSKAYFTAKITLLVSGKG